MQHEAGKQNGPERSLVMFKSLFGGKTRSNQAITDALYGEIVAAARREPFYAQWAVPDTPLGRFEMVSLHMFLLQHRLRGIEGPARDIAQSLIDDFFLEVDHSLRELGIGDSSVPKRIKKLARMFYGRTNSYAEAIDDGDRAALSAALARNIRPDSASWPEAGLLAGYVLSAVTVLAEQPVEDICAGKLRFPPAAEEAA